MTDAIHVARHLIYLASAEEEPELLSHLRLQKLLYYTQGWSLALRNGRPMFAERIEAWAHGPVVKDLWSVFSQYGNRPIPSEDFVDSHVMDEDDRLLVGAVWSAYKGYTAFGLSEMTHNESPWRDARGNLSSTARSGAEITKEAMMKYFVARAAKRA
jgi:uncharacterized phage-associated protein